MYPRQREPAPGHPIAPQNKTRSFPPPGGQWWPAGRYRDRATVRLTVPDRASPPRRAVAFPVSSTLPRSPTERGALCILDRSLVTLIALGRLIDTTGVKRTLEITNKRANYHVDLERASLKIYPLHI